MKGDKEHRVPLSDRALAILAELPREAGSDAVFPGRSDGGFMNQDAMADVLAKLRAGVTRARLPIDVPRLGGGDDALSEPRLEMALAHAIPSAVETVLPARRPVREARAAHGRLGGLLRSARARQGGGAPALSRPFTSAPATAAALSGWCGRRRPGARVAFNPTQRGSS